MFFKNFSRGFLYGTFLGAGIIFLGTTKSSRELRQGLQSYLDHLLKVGREAMQARQAELEARLAAAETKSSLRKSDDAA